MESENKSWTSITVEKEKAEYLKQIGTLSLKSLDILAAKSKKPGIEQKLQTWQKWI